MVSDNRTTSILGYTVLVAVVLTMAGSHPARADCVFGPRTNLGPTVNSPVDDMFPVLSPDGLELYFTSFRSGGQGNADIWVAKRASVQDSWGRPANLGPNVNTSGWESAFSMSADGLTLYFDSGGPSGHVYQTTRATRDAPWGPGVIVGPAVGAGSGEAVVSFDGLELYFIASWPGGSGRWDIWVSTRATCSDPWGPPVNLGPTINTSYDDCCNWISRDGLTLLLSSNRPGGFGNGDMWVTTRPSKSSAWSRPRNLGPSINTTYADDIVSISSDGRMCYFDDWGGSRPGGLGGGDLWQAPIIPVLDLNGDGKVDETDLSIMMEHRGQNYPLCDIGPFPWGDGIVDFEDVKVLVEAIDGTELSANPGPFASGVPCDANLSWTSPSFAPTCDVYLGTSFDDVNDASRTNPKDVLVSQGQTATIYDPEGLLELQKTYYWRVDFVDAEPNCTIYKGTVWQFTTETAIHPVQNVTATASSFMPNMGPENTVNGSGLDAKDLHSAESKDMWWSRAEKVHWIQYQFDRVYKLREMWVWNYNTSLEPSVGFGARTVKIEYSIDGQTWTLLEGVPEFAQAPGQSGYAANTKVDFGGVSAQFVKLTIDKNWGMSKQTGLSEVRFYALSAAAAAEP